MDLMECRKRLDEIDQEIVRLAVKSMGLDDLKPFLPERKVIEYCLAACQ